MSAAAQVPRFRFSRSMRLSGSLAFTAVFDSKLRRGAGPLVIFSKPNALPHCRLGLTVGRRVGNAVQRNRIKRLLREAFRLGQHELPPGLDLVVVVKPHAPLDLDRYRALLVSSARGLAHAWSRRESTPTVAAQPDRRAAADGAPTEGAGSHPTVLPPAESA